MQAAAFYGEGWFKLVGSLDHTSDLMMIKLIPLEEREQLLVVAIYPSMLWVALCAYG